jgi:alpha-L-fucosidase 2
MFKAVKMNLSFAFLFVVFICGAVGCAAAFAMDVPVPAADQNLVLTAPIRNWDEAIPLGNGLMGGLLWGEKNILRLSLDRGDLWDVRQAAEQCHHII